MYRLSGGHGDDDEVIDPENQNVYFSPNATVHIPYHSESNCLLTANTYNVLNTGTPTHRDMIEVGSSKIYDYLRAASISAECYLDSDMTHGIKVPATDNFNCPTHSTKTDVYKYIVARSAVFFQSVMYLGTASSFKTHSYISADFTCP